MIKGNYQCPYCKDICNEQGIKAHIMKKHKLLHEEFGFKHLNHQPTGTEEYVKNQEAMQDMLDDDYLKILELDRPANEKTNDNEKNENVFEKEEEKRDAELITKQDLLGLDQTDDKQEETPQQIIVYACGTCGANVTEEMQVCPNCGDKLNWAEVE